MIFSPEAFYDFLLLRMALPVHTAAAAVAPMIHTQSSMLDSSPVFGADAVLLPACAAVGTGAAVGCTGVFAGCTGPVIDLKAVVTAVTKAGSDGHGISESVSVFFIVFSLSFSDAYS